MSIRPGSILGNYRILALVGTGGMGQVFKAEHTLTKRIEAVKILAHRQETSSDQINRFLREIEVHARLNHPNIVPVHSAFHAQDIVGMSMEFVDGRSLEELLDRKSVSLSQALDFACQLLCALGYAHSTGIVHRDISPANVIVTEEGRVMLTDFGLAKPFKDKRVTQGVTAIGSILYMSPEQVRALPSIDGRADIYALGAVLYEMVTGRPPFDAESVFHVMLAHVDQTPTAPAEWKPDLPAALGDLLMKALSKAPADRFQTANEFLQALIPIRDAVCGNTFTESTASFPFAFSNSGVRAPMVRAGATAMMWVCAAALIIGAGLQIRRGVLASPTQVDLAGVKTYVALERLMFPPPLVLQSTGKITIPSALFGPLPPPRPAAAGARTVDDVSALPEPEAGESVPVVATKRLRVAAGIPLSHIPESTKPVYITIPPPLPSTTLTAAGGPVPTPPSQVPVIVSSRVPEKKKKRHPFIRVLGTIFAPDAKHGSPEQEMRN